MPQKSENKIQLSGALFVLWAYSNLAAICGWLMLLTILDNRTSSYASSVEFDVASFCFDWSQTLPKFEFESWKWMTMTTGDPVFWRWCVVRDSSSFETVASKDITSPVFKETTLEGCLTSPWTHIVFILSWKRGKPIHRRSNFCKFL